MKQSKEAKYALYFSKFESDLQVVQYYESGYYKGKELFESLSRQWISYCISKEKRKTEEKGNVLK